MFPARSQIRPQSQPSRLHRPGTMEGSRLDLLAGPPNQSAGLFARMARWVWRCCWCCPAGRNTGRCRSRLCEGTGTQAGGSMSGMGDTDPIEEERRLRALNAERQKSLVSDTNKLLKLAHELNDEVNATKSDSLDPQELTQVAEIEKLAHKREGKDEHVRKRNDGFPALSFSPAPIAAGSPFSRRRPGQASAAPPFPSGLLQSGLEREDPRKRVDRFFFRSQGNGIGNFQRS